MGVWMVQSKCCVLLGGKLGSGTLSARSSMALCWYGRFKKGKSWGCSSSLLRGAGRREVVPKVLLSLLSLFGVCVAGMIVPAGAATCPASPAVWFRCTGLHAAGSWGFPSKPKLGCKGRQGFALGTKTSPRSLPERPAGVLGRVSFSASPPGTKQDPLAGDPQATAVLHGEQWPLGRGFHRPSPLWIGLQLSQ